MTSDAWQRGEGTAQLGYANGDVWLRYKIEPNPEIRVLTISNPWLFRFDLHRVASDGSVDTFELGSARPLENRPLGTTNFAIPLRPNTVAIYIHDSGVSSVNYPISISSTTQASYDNAVLNVLLGLYYGFVIIMVLYNLALFLGTRDQAYLFYSLYALALMTFLAASDGMGAAFVWTDMPSLQYLFAALGWGLSLSFLLEFASKFLSIDRTRVTFVRISQGTIALVALLSMVNPLESSYFLQTFISYFVLSYLIYLGISGVLTKSQPALVFLLACGAFAIGGFVHATMLFGFLEPSFSTQHAVHIGSAIELTLLAFALVLRVRDAELKRFEALRRSQELVRRNRELTTARALAEEHRQLQKSLQQAQKLKTIGQLAGGFAHDFNNILASILGFAELAQTPKVHADRAKLSRYLDEIVTSGRRGADLVKQLLVYSRSTPPEPRDLNMIATVKDCVSFIRGSLPATVAIDTHLPEHAIRLQSDPEQIQQMLVNICLNAAEATHNRGSINIALEERHINNLTCSSCLSRFSGDFVAITVEDDGPGFNGNASDLFTPFATTKEVGQGTGLGLSVVHGIAHEHRGHVHAANRAEGGARVTVYLPLLEFDPVAAEDRTRQRVLIIEDDPSVATYLAALLGDASIDSQIAKLPAEALQTFVADPDAFDLVITDHLMPQGTGIELAEDLHALRPELPVLLTTGNATNINREELDRAGILGVYPKPLNSEQLLAKIRSLLAA